MNAIKLLKADHRTVEALFKKVTATNNIGERAGLFTQIKAELTVHAHIEEAILYPSILEEGDQDLVDIISEAIKEHQQARAFLGTLAVSVPNKERFNALLLKLIDDVRHHVKEEEQEMFPMVEAQFPKEALELWGEQLEEEKARFAVSTESAYN